MKIIIGLIIGLMTSSAFSQVWLQSPPLKVNAHLDEFELKNIKDACK